LKKARTCANDPLNSIGNRGSERVTNFLIVTLFKSDRWSLISLLAVRKFAYYLEMKILAKYL
jgi:hypothetical protein